MSEYLVWSEEYATGVEMIDGDHQTLFMMVNTLHDALVRDGATDQLPHLFERLSDYVNGHFGREEALMRQCGYPLLDEHSEKHHQLERTLRKMVVEFSTDPTAFPADDLMDFLKNWLTSHVLKSDMHYVPFVNEQKALRT